MFQAYNHFLKGSEADPDNTFTCSECSKEFKSSSMLSDHKLAHRQAFQCEHCHYKAPTPSALKTHIKYKHISERTVPCSSCDYKGKTDADIRSHKRIHETQDKSIPCLYGCNFVSKKGILQTMARHYAKCKEKQVKESYEGNNDPSVNTRRETPSKSRKKQLAVFFGENVDNGRQKKSYETKDKSSQCKFGCNFVSKKGTLKAMERHYVKCKRKQKETDTGFNNSDKKRTTETSVTFDTFLSPADTFMKPAESPLTTSITILSTADKLMPPADTVLKPADTLLQPADTFRVPTDTILTPADTLMTYSVNFLKSTDTLLTPVGTLLTLADNFLTPAETFLTPADTLLTPPETFLTPTETFLTPPETFLTPAEDFNDPVVKRTKETTTRVRKKVAIFVTKNNRN